MARLSSDGKYVIVEKGDTLSEIARDYGNGKTYQQLAAINKISNANRIYINQKIYLNVSSSAPTVKEEKDATKVTIKEFGYQSDSSGTLFATWSWSRTDKDGKSTTEKYEVQWDYSTGDGVWFVGDRSDTEHQQDTYSMPANATKVRFRVKPVAKKHKVNGKETAYWTGEWCAYKYYKKSELPPETPPVPSIKIEKFKLTASVDNLDVNATHIQFKIVKDNTKTFKTGTAKISTNDASYSCTVDVGGEYKVACRSKRDDEYSDWSDYSNPETTIPSAPTEITTCKATSKTSIQLKWTKVSTADSYTIQYTTEDKRYFNGSNNVTSQDAETNSYELTGLESGQEYFFRVRAVNEKGESGWSPIKSIIIGTKPAAPTTWSSTSTVMVDEDLVLYWMHNSKDGSKETTAQLDMRINGSGGIVEIERPAMDDEDEDTKPSSYTVPALDFEEGCKITWRVRTAGITGEYGDWSTLRTVDVYAPPVLRLSLENLNDEFIDEVSEFPFMIRASAGPNTQKPIGYHLSIMSNSQYETLDHVGNEVLIKAGTEVYSKYFDINRDLQVYIAAGDVDLQNGATYTITCMVTMDSGLTAEAEILFRVSWFEKLWAPNAEIILDENTYVTHIKPFCKEYSESVHVVEKNNATYNIQSTTLDYVYGSAVANTFTSSGEQVYKGVDHLGVDRYYAYQQSEKDIEHVTLSVYRREFDGTFTEIASDISNDNTFVTDPHPALDYARYRIVATDSDTGAITYTDIAGYPVNCKAVIIQWDEAWSRFNATNEDELVEPAWAGSLLKLPYNIDVSDSNAPDVELIEYIGREHPVGYYGTQRGMTATWNVEIPKDDVDTLYALRRLQRWMGNAYVREPSGSGYWANIKVSFNQKHRNLTIPVTFTITRVEGGV